jgi:hypothetical protein
VAPTALESPGNHSSVTSITSITFITFIAVLQQPSGEELIDLASHGFIL